jgi:adenylate cyclase class IV
MSSVELELKAIVADPIALRVRLLAAGARPGFRGLMQDQRFDRGETLTARDEVLRLRTYRSEEGSVRTEVGWKGPVTVSSQGYKQRTELEYEMVSRGAAPPAALLQALGFAVVHQIDRYVEYYELHQATVRLEWYPRMDALVEVEGAGAAIEAAIAATGLSRSLFTPQSLAEFVTQYQSRTGHPGLTSVPELAGAAPSWAGLTALCP